MHHGRANQSYALWEQCIKSKAWALSVVPHFSLSPSHVAFLTWDDFYTCSYFARSTIPEGKWGTTRSLINYKHFYLIRLLSYYYTNLVGFYSLHLHPPVSEIDKWAYVPDFEKLWAIKVAEQFWQFVNICHLPNHGKRRVAAHKLKLGKWKIYWWKILKFPWQHERLNTTLKFHFCSVYIKFTH